MNEELKVKYLLSDIEVVQNMDQSQLSDLLKQDNVFLLSVNNNYRYRHKRGLKSK